MSLYIYINLLLFSTLPTPYLCFFIFVFSFFIHFFSFFILFFPTFFDLFFPFHLRTLPPANDINELDDSDDSDLQVPEEFSPILDELPLYTDTTALGIALYWAPR